MGGGSSHASSSSTTSAVGGGHPSAHIHRHQPDIKNTPKESKPNLNYTEYTLLSSGSGSSSGDGTPTLKHHILKLTLPSSRLAAYEAAIAAGVDETHAPSEVLFRSPVSLKRASAPTPSSRTSSSGLAVVEDTMETAKPTYDASKVAPSYKVEKSSTNYQKKTKSYFFGREDLVDLVPVNQKSQAVRKTTTTTTTSSTSASSSKTIVTTTRYMDPDKYPWVLEEGGGGPHSTDRNVYIGSKEQDGAGSHVLFVMADATSFKVVPAAKTYKFIMKPTYRTLSAEEAEAAITSRKSMWNGIEHGDASTGPSGEPIRSWERIGQSLDQKVTSKSTKAVSRSNGDGGGFHEEMEDFDFDEVVSDDEEVNFGLDDADAAKEAQYRMYGKYATKAGFEGEFEEIADQPSRMDVDKKITKTLFKTERNDAYLAVEEDVENPYLSDDSAEGYQDEEKEVQKAGSQKSSAVPAARPAKTSSASKGKLISASRAGSPQVEDLSSIIKREPKREQSPASETSSVLSGRGRDSRMTTPSVGGSDKRKRGDESRSPRSISRKIKEEPGHTPAPPTAAEVLAKEREKKRKLKMAAASSSGRTALSESGRSSVAGSDSPPPISYSARSESSPPVKRPGSAASSSHAADEESVYSNAIVLTDDANLLTEEDIINVIRNATGPLSVKDIVAALKGKLQADSRNKDRMKELFKRVAKNEKGASGGGVRLKDEYL